MGSGESNGVGSAGRWRWFFCRGVPVIVFSVWRVHVCADDTFAVDAALYRRPSRARSTSQTAQLVTMPASPASGLAQRQVSLCAHTVTRSSVGSLDVLVATQVDLDNPNVPNFREAMVSGWARTPQPEVAAAGGGNKRKNKRGTVLFTVG